MKPCEECFWRWDKIVSLVGDLPDDVKAAVLTQIHTLHGGQDDEKGGHGNEHRR